MVGPSHGSVQANMTHDMSLKIDIRKYGTFYCDMQALAQLLSVHVCETLFPW